MGAENTARRKDSHLDLAAHAEVEPAGNRTLFECVHLVHCALPELALEQVDVSARMFGKALGAPLVITGMTGGTERAGKVNRDLAALAEKLGVAFGVGSQRAMQEDMGRSATFQVRQVAPTTVVLGNIGLRQAAQLGVSGVQRLAEAIGADGMALHLNAAQELAQPEGDRDFRDGYSTVAALAKAFGERLLVKETGCGISPDVARRLVGAGVTALDVSGLGGTSWVRVEQLRATGADQEVGRVFSEWGIPTAAALPSVRAAVGEASLLIASGGIRTGLDVAKALALGANLAGMALPLFRAQQSGGAAGAQRALENVVTALKHALLLTGSRTVAELRRCKKVITGDLKDWVSAL
jgi:isopentenyl-diphosphate delta-isomerase